MEEKFVFPIGRRTWQILSLIALVTLALSIVYYLYNSTPTSRDSVSVSKNEVVENKIDTAAAATVVVSECKQEELTAWLDTIKADLPQSEWTNLGDSTEPYQSQVYTEDGYAVTDENGYPVYETKRGFNSNSKAIPNVINEIYTQKGLDSSSVCGRIEVLKALHALNKITDPGYLKDEAVFNHAQIVGGAVTLDLINKSKELYLVIENSEAKIVNNESYQSFGAYLYYLNSNNPTEERVDAVKSLLAAHRKISNPKYKSKDYFNIAEIIFESSLPDKELSSAVDGFNGDVEFYDTNGLKNSLKKYLKLYSEKLERAEAEQSSKKVQKAIKRGESAVAAGWAFLSIVSIATILLLFSIQSLLKGHVNNKE
jgi:hypothetical protein